MTYITDPTEYNTGGKEGNNKIENALHIKEDPSHDYITSITIPVIKVASCEIA